MLQTKGYYVPETNIIRPSVRDMNGLQIFYDIPWNDVYSTGWIFQKDNTWGQENKMALKPNPEHFAPGNLLRTNGGMPNINPNDPKYKFSRQENTVTIASPY